jgi:hypothetical protein
MPFLTRRQALIGIAKALGGAALGVRQWFGAPTVQAQGPSPTR